MPWIPKPSFIGKIAEFPGQVRDFGLEFVVSVTGAEPTNWIFDKLLNEYPMTASKAGKEALTKALVASSEEENPSQLLNAIMKVSMDEDLDQQRTSAAMFACGYSFVKKYSLKAYKACVYLLGL
jgi:hypothetical protein